jgi:hypothetical protein
MARDSNQLNHKSPLQRVATQLATTLVRWFSRPRRAPPRLEDAASYAGHVPKATPTRPEVGRSGPADGAGSCQLGNGSCATGAPASTTTVYPWSVGGGASRPRDLW